jgi:hypothetical protein
MVALLARRQPLEVAPPTGPRELRLRAAPGPA